VAYSRNKVALPTRLRNINLNINLSLIVSETSALKFTIFSNLRAVCGRLSGLFFGSTDRY